LRVVLSDEAEADLEGITDWISRDNPLRAETFVDELVESCERLAANPLAFEVVERFRNQGLRRRVHGSYLIFYVPREDQINVLRIIHGARDYEALLIEDGWFD
jgi:plasmid stabilization system protein ParE